MSPRFALAAVVLAAVLASGALAPRAALARCAPRGVEVVVLTPTSVTVPTGGSFVVGLVVQRSHGGRRDAMPEALSITRGERNVALRLETIAPGLARATPVEAPAAGEWSLAGDGVRAGQSVTFGDAAMPPPPAAPRVRSVVRRQVSPGSRRAPAQFSVAATLARAPERGVAVAVVTNNGSGSWMAIENAARAVELYPRVGRCQLMPDGFTPLRAGREARVVVVDAFGRTAASDAVTVR